MERYFLQEYADAEETEVAMDLVRLSSFNDLVYRVSGIKDIIKEYEFLRDNCPDSMNLYSREVRGYDVVVKTFNRVLEIFNDEINSRPEMN